MKDEFWDSNKMQQMYFDKQLALDDMSKQNLAVLLTDLVDTAEDENEFELLDKCFDKMQKFSNFPVESDREKLFKRLESKIENDNLPKEA